MNDKYDGSDIDEMDGWMIWWINKSMNDECNKWMNDNKWSMIMNWINEYEWWMNDDQWMMMMNK